MLDTTRDVVSIILMLLAIVFMVGLVVAGYVMYKKLIQIVTMVHETVAQAKSTVETVAEGIVMPIAKGAAIGAIVTKVAGMVKSFLGDKDTPQDGKPKDNASV